MNGRSECPFGHMNSTDPCPADVGRPDAPTIRDVRFLGGKAALYLLALVRAHYSRARLAPTPQARQEVLSVLATLGLVRTDLELTTDSLVTGDKMAWVYAWPYVPFSELEGYLVRHLTNEGRHADYATTWLRIWQELIPLEVTAYLHYQLRIHHFSDAFLSELAPLLVPNESRYGLGHWRYACWAAVRSMASVSLQYPGNAEILKFTLSAELPRRLKLAQGSLEGKLCFSPSHSLPDSALSTAFYSVATNLGNRFWLSPPTLELI